MVTMFDMVTGELIAGDSQTGVELQAAADSRDMEHARLAPRLEAVVETTARQHPHRLPADLATTSVTAFLARQQG